MPFVDRLSKNIIIELKEANLDFIEYANATGWNIIFDENRVIEEINLFIQSYKNKNRFSNSIIYNFWNDIYNKIFDGQKLIKNELKKEIEFLESNFSFTIKGFGLAFECKVAYVCAALDPIKNWTIIKEKVLLSGGNINLYDTYFQKYVDENSHEYREDDDLVVLANKIDNLANINDDQIINSFKTYFLDYITLNDYILADGLRKIFKNLIQRNEINRIIFLIDRLVPLIHERSIAPYQDLISIIQLVDFELTIPSRFLFAILKSLQNAIRNNEDDFLIKESLDTFSRNLLNKKIYLDETVRIEDFNLLLEFFEKTKPKEYRKASEECFYALFVLLKFKFHEEYDKASGINRPEFSISYKQRFSILKDQVELDQFSDIISIITREKLTFLRMILMLINCVYLLLRFRICSIQKMAIWF